MCVNPIKSVLNKQYDWTPCPGCYINNLKVFNTTTGRSFKPICKSYKCNKHGWMHAKRLEEALAEYLKGFDQIRLWTFTLSSKDYNSTAQHARDLSKVWRYFMTYLRRSNLFNKKQKDMQYVRFAERHKSGYWHLHVIVNTWLKWSFVQALWERSCAIVLEKEGKLGHVNVKGSKSPKSAAKYVAKYVTKASRWAERNMKLWTKSSKVSLFVKEKSSNSYAIYNSANGKWYGLRDPNPTDLIYGAEIGSLNLSINTSSSQMNANLNHKQELLL